MFKRVLPQPIDNTYRGSKVALLLLAIVVIVKIAQSIAVFATGYSIVVDADGIPLDTYTPAAAQTIVAMFEISALSRLILSLLGILALVRYRSAVPFVLVVLAIDYLGRELILYLVPMVRVASPLGPIVNLALFALTIVGLVLSLWRKRKLSAQW